jgi:hypothetical protein
MVAQGPVDLPEHHVREVGVERAPTGELECAAAQPLTDAVAVIQVNSMVARSNARSLVSAGGLMSITPQMPAPVVSRLARVKS